jgi:hypothetical protein
MSEKLNKLSPVVMFVYNRLKHTQQTIEALQNNLLAAESDLYIFSDAPKSAAHFVGTEEVRKYILKINGFKSITIVERKTNFGLAKSIIDGVTKVVKKHGRIIVLEDDMITSPHFLTYMNEALDKYADDNRVASIHGYVYPVKQFLPEAFFLRGADCWGWATWQRGWKLFNPDGRQLLDELKQKKLIGAFDFNGAYPFSSMLKGQIKGSNDSWAVRWHASAFLAEKLTLYPGHSLVNNIGNDSSGTHSGSDMVYDVKLSRSAIDLANIKVESSAIGQAAFEAFFRKNQGSFASKLLLLIKRILAKAIA